VGSVQNGRSADDSGPSASEYVRSLRLAAGLSIGEVARKAGVEEDWLQRFEAGPVEQGPNYDLLLKLIAATQPPARIGGIADMSTTCTYLQVPVRDRDRHRAYWERIEQVRETNRRVGRP
jgi:transcriptional regulator with XRE-family HTH domain